MNPRFSPHCRQCAYKSENERQTPTVLGDARRNRSHLFRSGEVGPGEPGAGNCSSTVASPAASAGPDRYRTSQQKAINRVDGSMNWAKLYGRIFARRRFARFNSLLYGCAVRGLGCLQWEDFRASGEESFVRTFFKSQVTTQFPIVFDVGAYCGDYGAMVRRYSPSAAIYAFEPHPQSFTVLDARAMRHRIVALNLACAERSGVAELFDLAEADGSRIASLDRAVFDQHYHQSCRPLPVMTTTIDRFAEEHGIDRIDLLKIDTEGTELAVLRGARRMIRTGSIAAVQFEFNAMAAIRRTFLRDFYEELPDHQFHRLLPDGLLALGPYRSALEIFHYQNIVALLERPERDLMRQSVRRVGVESASAGTAWNGRPESIDVSAENRPVRRHKQARRGSR
jgi:FkbM family methyltransferase